MFETFFQLIDTRLMVFSLLHAAVTMCLIVIVIRLLRRVVSPNAIKILVSAIVAAILIVLVYIVVFSPARPHVSPIGGTGDTASLVWLNVTDQFLYLYARLTLPVTLLGIALITRVLMPRAQTQ